jgi:exodeoxyribonuclease VII large subunit
MTEPASYFREKRLLLDFQSSRLAYGMRHAAAGQRERLSALSAALPGSAARTVAQRRERLNALAAALDAMSPLKVLGRGYAIAQREDGKAVISAADVASGDKLKLTLSDGSVNCRVL